MEATDSKGEPIHQTLMAKKMQRLDESPDFRPFKFRIQAFTNAFLEEVTSHSPLLPSRPAPQLTALRHQLARQGFPEEKIPMKKASLRFCRAILRQRLPPAPLPRHVS